MSEHGDNPLSAVGHVSHELKTPLAIIRESVAQVAEGILGSVNDDQKEFLMLATGCCDQLQVMIDDISDVLKLHAGLMLLRKTRINLTEMIQEVSKDTGLKAEAKGLGFSAEFPKGDLWARVDLRRIRQALEKIIENGLKFTQEGGIALRVIEKDGCALIAVKDTGCGFDVKADLERYCEKFVQGPQPENSRDRGVGLGLTFAKHILELHGGQLEADSRPDQGSLFRLSIPLLPDVSGPEPGAANKHLDRAGD